MVGQIWSLSYCLLILGLEGWRLEGGVGRGGGSRDRTPRPTVGYSVSGFHMRLEGHGGEGSQIFLTFNQKQFGLKSDGADGLWP